MHSQPQRTLKRLIKQYGPDLVHDPRRTESLLNDLCGQHRREIFVLVNAQKQRVPAELLSAPAWMPRQATWARLSRQLQDKLALTEDAADWAVAAWAGALDLNPDAAKPSWPWQRNPQPAPTSTAASTKSKKKKRQSGQVHVQYEAEPARRTRRNRTRSARAEYGTGPFSLTLPVLNREPVAKFVMWAAILLVSAALLFVVVNAMTRPDMVDDPSALAAMPEQSGSQGDQPPASAAQPVIGAQSDLDYLNAAVTLPSAAWVINMDDPLLVRLGPSTNEAYFDTLEAKTGVTVVEFSPDGRWSHIVLPTDGWVSSQFLSFMTDDAAKQMVQLQVQRQTITAPLSVYALPDLAGEPIAQLTQGDGLVTVAITLDGSWRRSAEPVAGWVPSQDLAANP